MTGPFASATKTCPVTHRCSSSSREATSVYIDETARGQGIGRRIVEHQITAAGSVGFWTLQTSIFPENLASLRIHEAAGFRRVGHRERIAQLDSTWRDTVLLEWRSRNPTA